MRLVVISCSFIKIELWRTDLVDQYKVARISLRISNSPGYPFWEVGDIPGSHLDPFAADVDLTFAFETHHGFVRHVVIVQSAFLARTEHQHVDTLGLKSIPRPRNQPRAHILCGDFYSVVQVPDRAA